MDNGPAVKCISLGKRNFLDVLGLLDVIIPLVTLPFLRSEEGGLSG